MKKKRNKKEEKDQVSGSLSEEQRTNEDILLEQKDETSINDFIKIKKLQNHILEKMLEKISQPDLKGKTTKRTTK